MGLETEGIEQLSTPTGFRITASAVQGGRRYMEDRIYVEAARDMYGNLDHLFAAVYDGHGGAQASEYVCKNLHNNMKNNKAFYSDDDTEVLSSIREAFLTTHHTMQKMVESWPMTSSGFPCTAGTTASVVIIRGSKLYTGHVGDSAIVLINGGRSDNRLFTARKLTEDHKPDSEVERRRIELLGGNVAQKAGVTRVVWKRPINGHTGPICCSTTTEMIPFLAVARALGDFWSLNPANNEYIVSPEPDVSVAELSVLDLFIVIASDGLTNVMKSRQTANKVFQLYQYKHNIRGCDFITKKESLSPNYAQFLIKEALDSWRFVRADNISVVSIELLFGKQFRSASTNASPSNSASSMFVSSPSFSSLSDLDSISGPDFTESDGFGSVVEKNPFMDINDALANYPCSMIHVTPTCTYRCRTNAVRVKLQQGAFPGIVADFKGPGFLTPPSDNLPDDENLSDDEVGFNESVVDISFSSTPTSTTNKNDDLSGLSLKKWTPLTTAERPSVATPSSLMSPFAMLATIRSSASMRTEMEALSSTTWRRSTTITQTTTVEQTPLSHVTANGGRLPMVAGCEGDTDRQDIPVDKPLEMTKVDSSKKIAEQNRRPVYHRLFAAFGDLNGGDNVDVYAFSGTPPNVEIRGSTPVSSRKRPVRSQNDSASSPTETDEKKKKRIRLSEPKRASLSSGESAIRAQPKPNVQPTTTRGGFLNMQLPSAIFSRDKFSGLRTTNSAPNSSSVLQPKPHCTPAPKRGLWSFVSSVFSKYMP